MTTPAATRYSEAEYTFTTPQDWSKYGVTTLVIWFRGDATTSRPQSMPRSTARKSSINNGAASTALPVWKQWNITLSSVAGLNLKSIKTLAIGVGDGNSGGTGTIFIDDIRLYATAPQVAAPADPGTNGLSLLYAMEGNVQDGSGKKQDGTTSGDPVYVQGMAGYGKAMQFDGLNDYVTLPIGSLLSTLTNSTFTVWVNFSDAGGAWQRVFDFGTDDTNYMFLTPSTGQAPRFAIRTATVGEQIADSSSAAWDRLASPGGRDRRREHDPAAVPGWLAGRHRRHYPAAKGPGHHDAELARPLAVHSRPVLQRLDRRFPHL